MCAKVDTNAAVRHGFFHVHPVWCEKAAEARSVLVESPK